MSSSSPVKRFFSQSSHYLTGTTLITLSHLFTFPIFTRVFSVAEYGYLSLITVSISTVLAISKLGLSNSAVRFYEESHAPRGMYTQDQYYSTFFLAACVTGAVITLLSALAAQLLSGIAFESSLKSLFLFASSIIFLRTLTATLMSFMRGAQKTKTYNLIETVTSYVSSGLSILLTLFWIKGLFGFYAGQIIALILLVLLLAGNILKKHDIRPANFSPGLFRESIRFGLPFVGLEFLNHILTYGDRFFINLFCPPEALGIYSVGYNLSGYVSNMIMVPLSCAATPILIRTWTQEGPEATSRFLASSVRYLTLFFFPAIMGFIALDEELIKILASEKYAGAAAIVPYAVIGIGFFALSNITNAGLIIHKRSDRILLHSAVAAILNTVLNIILIPRFSILGAAIATLVAYAWFFISITRSSYSRLQFSVPVGKIVLYFSCAVGMYLTIIMITFQSLYLTIMSRIAIGAMLYSLLILFFDSDIRMRTKRILSL